MSRKLLIVESPNKVKKIQGFLGAGWTVRASVGHVRDLPKSATGVDLKTFRPDYEVTNPKVVQGLKSAAKEASAVYLATDPDREGEAIAWHLQQVLGLRKPHRVTFQEITPSAISAAVERPREIDLHLVAAQEGRRVIDRLVGYTVSGPLSRVLRRQSRFAAVRASAGRVQTPAVRLVVERERAIRNFVPQDHFGVRLSFAGGWWADWQTKPWLPAGEALITDRDLAARVAKTRRVQVAQVKDGTATEAAPAPFTTSTLQQAASTALKMRPEATMKAAQSLFEAGAITYIRTDSPVLSEEAVGEIRAEAARRGWPVPATPPKYKAKGNAQEAHEAIRPTHIGETGTEGSPAEQALYGLIWRRTMASQLAPAEYATRAAQLHSLDHEGPKPYGFLATSRVLTRPGWRVTQQAESAALSEEEGEDREAANPVPVLAAGAPLHAERAEVLAKKTKAPARYTEASLIRALEEQGIGRPSTYAAIMSNIERRGYVSLRKRALAAEPLGEAVIDVLGPHFSFASLPYTAAMEEMLDQVAAGAVSYQKAVGSAWERLSAECTTQPDFALRSGENASGAHAAPEGPAIPCPQCGKRLRRIAGKNGFFWGCTGYPGCKTTFPDNDGAPDLEAKPRATAPSGPPGPPCSECGAPTTRRETAKGHPYYTCADRSHGPWWDEDGALGRAWVDKRSPAAQGQRRARYKT